MFARGHAAADDFVFTTMTGAPMSHRNVLGRGLKKAVEKAGLPPMRFHDLRHVYAALVIEQGWSEEYLASVMGHASSAFTREVYGGLFDRQKRLREATAGLEASHGATLERILADRRL
jgi:integrase